MENVSQELAIIGGGCSGALTALRVLRSPRPVGVHIVDSCPRLGYGLAYSTSCPLHLLNVPANGMSVSPESPDDFVEWLAADLGIPPDPHGFLPRETFGRYVADRLESARQQAHPRSMLIHHRAEALDVRREGGMAVLDLSGGERLSADLIVLALGNAPPRPLPYFPLGGTNPMFYDSAWSPGALNSDPKLPVGLIGSGLTAVDAFLGLRANGHRGVVHMVSPRGLLPQPHRAPNGSPQNNVGADVQYEDVSLRNLVRHLRRQVCSAELHGGDWRDVIASLRSSTNKLWSGFTRAERERFYRHVKAYWDIHRHRMAPQVAARIDAARRGAMLRVHTGRVERVTSTGDSVDLEIRGPSQAANYISVQRLINCTGPEQDYRRVDSCLLRSLFAKSWLDADALGIGIRTAGNGAVIDGRGGEISWLYAVGPMRIGGLLETTAIPDIREQTAEFARTLTAASGAIMPLKQISGALPPGYRPRAFT